MANTIREYNSNVTNKGREKATDIAIRELIESNAVLTQQLKEMAALQSSMIDLLGNISGVQHAMGTSVNEFRRKMGQAEIASDSKEN